MWIENNDLWAELTWNFSLSLNLILVHNVVLTERWWAYSFSSTTCRYVFYCFLKFHIFDVNSSSLVSPGLQPIVRPQLSSFKNLHKLTSRLRVARARRQPFFDTFCSSKVCRGIVCFYVVGCCNKIRNKRLLGSVLSRRVCLRPRCCWGWASPPPHSPWPPLHPPSHTRSVYSHLYSSVKGAQDLWKDGVIFQLTQQE